MGYRVELLPEAADDLRRLDKPVAQRVMRRLRWLSENLGTVEPESLTGEWRGLFKLRVGSYRVLYTLDEDEKAITVHLLGHRRDIYKKK